MTQCDGETCVCQISRTTELQSAEELDICLRALSQSIETCGFLLAGHAPPATVATLIRAAADVDRVARHLASKEPTPDGSTLV